MYHGCPEAIDLPGELPELDDDPDGADAPPPENTDPLLVPLGDERDTDRDDEIAADLDIGIDLSLTPDASPETNEELVLDIGELLDAALERGLGEDAGNEPPDPNEFDAGLDIQLLPEQPFDQDEPDTPAAPDELAGELPELDADEAGEPGNEPDWLEIDALAGSDEPLRDASVRWHARSVSGIDSPCRDLALAHGDVLVGGAGLWRAQGESAELVFSSDKPIESLAVTMGSVVYVNSAGLLRRLVLDAGANSTVVQSSDQDDTTTRRVVTVQDGERLIAVSGGGAAFESADGGRSWSRIALEGRVTAVPRGADRLLLLVERGDRRALVFRSAGRAPVEKQLAHTALLVASGDAPELALLEQVLVLLDPGRGLLVSADDGDTFSPVPGCAGAGAVCLGRFQGRIQAWIAIHSEWTGKTEIALVDPERASAERIAELMLAEPGEDAEAFPVSALCWDAALCRLWVAGAHGLMLVEPEDADESGGAAPL